MYIRLLKQKNHKSSLKTFLMILTYIHWGNSSFEGTIFKSDYDMKNEKEKKNIFCNFRKLTNILSQWCASRGNLNLSFTYLTLLQVRKAFFQLGFTPRKAEQLLEGMQVSSHKTVFFRNLGGFCKPNLTAKILCPETTNHAQNGFPDNP